MVGQQLDAGRLAAGLDRGPALDLGEERRDVGRRVRPDELLGQLEQGDDRPVTLARRLPVRDRVAPDAQLALERGRQAARRAVRSPSTRPSAVATRIARRTSGRAKKPLAADVERDARPRRARPRSPAAGRWSGRGWPSRRARVPAAAERPDRAGDAGQLGLVGREPADLRRGPRRQARDETLGRPRLPRPAVARRPRRARRPGPGWRAPGPRASSGSWSRG